MKYYSFFAFGGMVLLLAGAGCTPKTGVPQETEQTTPEQQNQVIAEESQAKQDMLREDLINRPDLIPYKGSVGGTMKVYAPDAVYFIDNGLVTAGFEDGHNAGTMTLRYTITEDGSVDWEVISSECAGCQAK